MPRKIRVACVQMDAAPAPTVERLERAERLVTTAAQDGAQLVLLPEVFNTGYIYSEDNFLRVEEPGGQTITWMESLAARLNLHLAGSLMLHEGNEITNALVLCAPDGRQWRYDKRHPWGWERGYFRPGKDVCVADLRLGESAIPCRAGMLVCWDLVHADLWQSYAGRVDLMLVNSCPPDFPNAAWRLPDGAQLTLKDLGRISERLTGSADAMFNGTLRQQAAWLGVPAMHAGACGRFSSPIPGGQFFTLAMLPMAPRLGRYLSQAKQVELSSAYVPACKIIDAGGKVVAELSQDQGETLTIAEIELADETPSPKEVQPKPSIPWAAYFLSDFILPWLSLSIYRRRLKYLQ